MGLMDDVVSQVSKMDEATIRAELLKVKEQRAKQKESQKNARAAMTPEEKEARKAKQAAYREKNADKFKATRDAYNKRPDVIEKRKAYMKQRNERSKAILARAKELGITA